MFSDYIQHCKCWTALRKVTILVIRIFITGKFLKEIKLLGSFLRQNLSIVRFMTTLRKIIPPGRE